jgi:hypothetical protein
MYVQIWAWAAVDERLDAGDVAGVTGIERPKDMS